MKKIILLLLLLAACATQQTKDLSTYTCPDCNVILISIDTFRGDHLTCAGYNKYDVDITKNICGFARNSNFFTQAISQAPSTEPSHASILTSTIPTRHQGFSMLKQSISEKYPLLSEILNQHGYSTGAFTGGVNVGAHFGFNRGFDEFYEYTEKFQGDTLELITQKGERWMSTAKKPFFLFLHTYEIHSPYTPKTEHAQLLDPDYNGTLGNISVGLLEKINRGSVKITPADLNHIIAMYDAEIINMDKTFAKFFSYLKDNNFLKNTIIILTSDHGEEFGEHGMVGWHSHSLYDELVHVPLIVAAPNLEPQVYTHLVRSIDIAPTVLSMLNLPIPTTFEGGLLWKEHEYAISEQDWFAPVPYSVRSTQWKYFWNQTAIKVFNLKDDPYEMQNLIGQNEAIEKKYYSIYAEHSKNPGTTEKVALSQEQLEQLRALGYMT